jgi:hypothetical protein
LAAGSRAPAAAAGSRAGGHRPARRRLSPPVVGPPMDRGSAGRTSPGHRPDGLCSGPGRLPAGSPLGRAQGRTGGRRTQLLPGPARPATTTPRRRQPCRPSVTRSTGQGSRPSGRTRSAAPGPDPGCGSTATSPRRTWSSPSRSSAGGPAPRSARRWGLTTTPGPGPGDGRRGKPWSDWPNPAGHQCRPSTARSSTRCSPTAPRRPPSRSGLSPMAAGRPGRRCCPPSP